LKNLAVAIAQVLISKNIAFCLYRLPDENDIRLAIDSEYVSSNKHKTFWLAPFCPQSSAKEIFMAVIAPHQYEEVLQECSSFVPKKSFPSLQLPPEISKDKYLSKAHTFIQDIRSGLLDKAILSRVIHQPTPSNFDIFDCFENLTNSYTDTFVYLLVHEQAGIWMGATAELLLNKKEQQLNVMALAGTQSKNNTGQYEWRDKEMEEHLMVGEHIEEIFDQHHFKLKKKHPTITIESGRVAHLRTDYIYEDEKNISLKSLLKDLHPTPAISGLPSKKGVEYILGHEGYDRKYYCGFMGETDFSSSADLYINLRCMQIEKEKIAVYVGGGITATSDPEEEWNETVLKSKTMIDKLYPTKTE